MLNYKAFTLYWQNIISTKSFSKLCDRLFYSKSTYQSVYEYDFNKNGYSIIYRTDSKTIIWTSAVNRGVNSARLQGVFWLWWCDFQFYRHRMSGSKGGNDPVILATAGYDHTIRFWQAHTGICYRTVQHPDSVSSLRSDNYCTIVLC